MNDIEAIRQLTARYNRASDEGDLADWLACYAPNATFTRSNAERSYAGPEELRLLLLETTVAARHVTTDFVIEVDGDTARQTCYLMFLDRRRQFAVSMFGTYHDKLVKSDGRWRFQARFLQVDEGPVG
ncbi:MAG TPA: nuclear transport factor 2 family protein [Trebonia sp.]|jgi:3-phenylpropionate/cinnamic acid dioxygenase small subunit|nr:nuclear transport factor 2 family protein [Trebonia sp.]